MKKNKSQLVVLGIDPATNTGVADTFGERVIWNLTALSDVTYTHPGLPYKAFGDRLNKQLTDRKYDIIAYEKAAFGAIGQGQTSAFHSRIEGILLAIAAVYRVPVLGIEPSKLKKFATGYGRATKEQMVKAAQTDGEKIEESDIADAYWCMQFARRSAEVDDFLENL